MNVCVLSTLRTFIYDPLVEWQKSRGRETASDIKAKEATGEVTNEEVTQPMNELYSYTGFYQWQDERLRINTTINIHL